MNVSGPLPAAPLPRPDENAGLMLRLNQRFNAEVLQVSGETVVLSIQGVRVVARLVSPEQGMALMNQRQAQFVVREITSHAVLIQHLGAETGLTEVASHQPDAVSVLLEGAALPSTPANQEVVRLLLARGVVVTPDLLQTLAQLRSQGISARRLERILDLIAQGVPLSPSVLNLVGEEAPPGLALWEALRRGLQQWLAQDDLEETLRAQGQYLLSLLEGLWVTEKGDEKAVLSERLMQWVNWFGRSLERALSLLNRHAPQEELDSALETSLVGWLWRFQRAAGEHMPAELRDVINRLMTQIRYEHMLGGPSPEGAGWGEWLSFSFPVTFASGEGGQPEWQMAHLRVATRHTSQERRVDPAYTRLVLDVVLTPGYIVRVDVSIVRQVVGTRVEVSTPDLARAAETELPGLRRQLEALGYVLQRAEVRVIPPANSEAQERSMVAWHLKTEVPFNVEV